MKIRIKFYKLVLVLVFVSRVSFGQEIFSEDVYKISSILRNILSNYVKMDFKEIVPMCEGKAKKDFQRLVYDTQDPVKYSQIQKEISLLSDPKIKEVKVYLNEGLGVATVEWKYKRSVPKGNSSETVEVSRETTYLFKKFGNSWKLISYR